MRKECINYKSIVNIKLKSNLAVDIVKEGNGDISTKSIIIIKLKKIRIVL